MVTGLSPSSAAYELSDPRASQPHFLNLFSHLKTGDHNPHF